MLGKGFHIGFKTCDKAFALLNLFGEITQEVIFQTVLLTLVVCFHQLQASYVYIQVHLFLNAFIACTQSFDFRIRQCGFINIITGTNGRFARHNLADELLLVFKCLPQVRIESRLGNITVDVNFGVHVALANDTTATLFKVARSPRCIKVMQSDKSVLDVHTGSHLKGGTHENTYLTGTDFAEQFLFASFGVCLVNESNLFSRNTSCHKFLSDVIVHGEARFFGGAVFFCKVLQCSDFRAVEITCRSFGSSM